MAGFAASVQLYVDRAKDNANEVIEATGLKILARLIQRSPVGNPELWKVNTEAVRQKNRASDINAALRGARKRGRVQLAPSTFHKKNTSKFGPVRPRMIKRGQGVLSAPLGYTGGRFRANWQITFNTPAKGVLDRVDPSGAETMSRGAGVLSTFSIEKDSVIYFVNNVPYATRLEFGYSKQAPNGMVRVTVQEFQKLFGEAAAQVNT